MKPRIDTNWKPRNYTKVYAIFNRRGAESAEKNIIPISTLRSLRLCGSFFSLLSWLVLLNISCANPRSLSTINLSLILSDTSRWYEGAQKWKQLVEERTAGKYKVNIFPNASLSNGNQQTELEMAQTGGLHASLESTILLSSLDPVFNVFSLPWLFKDYDIAQRVCDGPQGENILKVLESKGLVGLAYGANGFRQITNNKRPIRFLEDLKGLKVRVVSKLYIDVFKSLGADPSQMNFGELFTALSEGTMDGQENPLSVIWSARLYDVQKHLTVWDYSYDPIVFCFNKATWDLLPAEYQTVFRQAAVEAMQYERSLVAKDDKELLDKFKEKGMQVEVLSEEVRALFREKTTSVCDQYRQIVGEKTFDDFVAAIRGTT